MKIQYIVKQTKELEVSTDIQRENFITVAHRENGVRMYTAFIGKGENNRFKKSIKISPGGGVLVIKKMAGSALLNATVLLKEDHCNKVIRNEVFIELYKEQTALLDFDFEQLKKIEKL